MLLRLRQILLLSHATVAGARLGVKLPRGTVPLVAKLQLGVEATPVVKLPPRVAMSSMALLLRGVEPVDGQQRGVERVVVQQPEAAVLSAWTLQKQP